MDNLRVMAEGVTVSVEIKRYILDIIIFLRMHRAVAGGASARATKDFESLVRYYTTNFLSFPRGQQFTGPEDYSYPIIYLFTDNCAIYLGASHRCME